jgi:hypothetical protein
MNDHEQGSRRWPKSRRPGLQEIPKRSGAARGTRNAEGHIIGITAGGWTNEQIAQVVVEAYLNARGMKP